MKSSVVQANTFTQYPASKKLSGLAKQPYDLTVSSNLSPERIKKYIAQSCNYKLLFATERVDDAVLKALFELANEADVIDKMQRMQNGEVMNYIEGFPSENRPVLHTATRDFFENPISSPPAIEATKLARTEAEKLKSFIDKIDKTNQFTDLIMIAIGGSQLGPRANYLALRYLKKSGRNVHFISNVDPDDAAAVLRSIDPKKTLVAIVSKSGTTLETRTNENFARSYFQRSGVDPNKHFIAVTGKGSPMDDPSKYLECFYIWDWVGGRFSTSSMVGGVVLSFAYGFNVFWEFLRGANSMDKAALIPNPKDNISLMSALIGIWNRNFLGYQTLALIPYSQALRRFSAHIQQVEMESNGKHVDKKGQQVTFETCPIIWGERGTNAQHSFFQLLHQGTDVIPIEFVGYLEGQYGDDVDFLGTTSQEKLLSNMFAQSIALAKGKASDNPNKGFKGNRPSHLLISKQLTPYTLGVLLSYYEHKVAFQGFIWDINSFDQEGVQLGKVLAEQIIERFAGKGEPYPLGDAFIEQIRSL